MKKIQGYVEYLVRVEFEVNDNTTDEDIKQITNEKASNEWDSDSAISNIQWYGVNN